MKTILSLFLLCIGISLHPSHSLLTAAAPLARQPLTKRHQASFVSESTSHAPSIVQEDETTARSKRLSQATFGLIKVMVGSGMLALPAGLAAVTNSRKGLLPANLLLLLLSAISAYTFRLYGRLTEATQANTIGEIWKARRGGDAQAVSLINGLYCFGCLLSFFLILTDIGQFLLGVSRTTSLCGVLGLSASLCAVPLHQLAPLSVLGVAGSVLTTLFLGYRCPLVNASAAAPAAPAVIYNKLHSPAPLILVAMACVTTMAHFAAPQLYHSLQSDDNDRSSTTLSDFNRMTHRGFGLVSILNALVLVFGFGTFAGASHGFILNNFRTTDRLANAARGLVGLSVLGSVPHLVSATVGELQSNLHGGVSGLRVGVLVGLTLLAATIRNVSFVLGLNGALLGSAIVFVIPGWLGVSLATRRGERMVCRGLVGLGVVSALLGSLAAVLTQFFPQLL